MEKIPKIIHYCWFGGNPLDEKAQVCIKSWQRFFPGYQIIQWNEKNFDVNCTRFTQKAFEDKKWAFISDYARLFVIYEYGGLYFDTDVEVVASYDDILCSDADGFLGFEKSLHVNSGLGFGAVKHNAVIKQLLEIYDRIEYDKNDLAAIACPILTTELMEKYGLKREDVLQNVCGMDIYPSSYFAPVDYNTGRLKKTQQTHSIHWYAASWHSQEERKSMNQRRFWIRLVGENAVDTIIGILSGMKREGLWGYIWRRIRS